MYLIIITAQDGLGNYIKKESVISGNQLNSIKPVINDIKLFQSYTKGYITYTNNFPIGELKREEEKSAHNLYGLLPGYDLFYTLCPYNDYGLSNIISIDVYPFIKRIKLL